MKTIKTFMTMAILFAATLIYAQAPDGFNYQAVIRDGNGNLVTSGTVKLQFTINQTSATGTTVYKETQSKTPNSYGLVTATIGGGTVVSGTFSSINWGGDNYFLKVEADPTGGTNYANLGTIQFMSVPYASEAKHAASASSVNGSVVAQNSLAVQGGGSNFEIKPGYYGNTPNSGATTLDMPGSAYLYVWDNLEVANGLEVHGIGTFDDNVGIGTSNPTKKLDVDGEIKSTGYTCYNAVNNVHGNRFNIWWDGNTAHLYIDNTYVNSFVSLSDRRIKKDIKPIGNIGLSKLMALKPVSYKYKDVEGTIFKGSPILYDGFIADELQEVIPSAVVGKKDALTPDGKIQPQSINIIPVVSVLTKAMQEQQAQIEALTKQVESLTTENATYKAEITRIKDYLGLDLQGKK